MESTLKHTPGPWKVRYLKEGDPEKGFFVEGQKTDKNAPYNVDILSEDSSFYPEEQRLADAKLVAAAPDLLAACIEFCNKVECGKAKSTRSYNQMKEAIKKATA